MSKRPPQPFVLLTLILSLAGCEADDPAAPEIAPSPALSVAAEGAFQASAVAAGMDFTCALQDGAAFCWGRNDRGQLGNGSTDDTPIPTPVAGGRSFTSIVAGFIHVCGLSTGGSAYCWGSNSHGQLGGDLPPGFFTEPMPVAGELEFAQIAAGLLRTCGLTPGGAAYCWGRFSGEETADGTPTDTPVPTPVPGGLTFESISTDWNKACGLAPDGAGYCWGSVGDLGIGGGSGWAPEPIPAPLGGPWSAVVAAPLYGCAVDLAGKAWCWGDDFGTGKLGAGTPDPAGAEFPLPVAGGLTFASITTHHGNYVLGHTCGLTPSGKAYCWGENEDGELGGASSETCTWGSRTFPCSSSPVEVGGGLLFSSLALGAAVNSHTCGTGLDGVLYCWGSNARGQLGTGTHDDSPVPTPVVDPLEANAAGLTAMIEALVADGSLNHGQGNSLLSKLDGFLAALEKGGESAADKLGAFINEVEALVRGGVLTEEQGAAVISVAEALLALLES